MSTTDAAVTPALYLLGMGWYPFVDLPDDHRVTAADVEIHLHSDYVRASVRVDAGLRFVIDIADHRIADHPAARRVPFPGVGVIVLQMLEQEFYRELWRWARSDELQRLDALHRHGFPSEYW